MAALCGVHCINTLLQGPIFSEVDLAQVNGPCNMRGPCVIANAIACMQIVQDSGTGRGGLLLLFQQPGVNAIHYKLHGACMQIAHELDEKERDVMREGGMSDEYIQ